MPDEADDFIPTRWTLIERLKRWDDEKSWKDFFDIYWKLIYSAALKAGCTDAEAQETVQETVISVAKQMKEFKANPAYGSFKGWLLRVTRRRIVDQLRKRTPAGRADELRLMDDTGTSPANQVPDPAGDALAKFWEQEWQQNLLAAAIERVKEKASPKQFKIFYLLVARQQPAREVARTLGVNAAQVYLAKHRVSVLVKREVRELEKRMTMK